MDIQVSDLGTRRKELAITLPLEAVALEFGNAYAEVSQQVDFPGFRKGKVPISTVKKRFADHVGNDVCERLVSGALREAMDQEKLEVVGSPEFDLKREELKEDAAFSFKVKVDLKPVITMPEYKGIAVDKVKVSVEDKDVDEMIESLRSRYATEADVTEGELKDGENCMANCDLLVDGESVSTREDVYVAPASDMVFSAKAEKLAEALVGIKVGDSRDISVSIPDTYKEEALRGKEGVVKLTLTTIKRRELPEVNDEFAEKLGTEDVEELREEVTNNIKQQRESQSDADARRSLQDTLAEKTQIEVSDNMLARYEDYAFDRAKQQMSMYGLPEEMITGQEETMRKEAKETAKREVVLNALLDEIADKERVYATESDVVTAIAQEAQSQKTTPDVVKDYLEKQGIMDSFRNDIRKAKVTELLMEKATVTEIDPPAKAEDK